MFLKQEKPEKDDFERKEYFGFKGKFFKKSIFLENMYFILMDILANNFNIYEYYFVS